MVELFTWIKFQTCETQLLILAITEYSSILNLFFHLTEIMCLLANPHQSLLTGLQWSFYFHEFSIFHSVQKWYQIVCLQDFIQHVFHVYSSCKCHSLFLFKDEYYSTMNYIFFAHQWKENWFSILATMKNKQKSLLLTIYICTCCYYI